MQDSDQTGHRMKLAEWGTVAEITSAFAVIVTLIVLTIEVRSNTKAIERTYQQESIRLGATARSSLFEVDGLVELIVKESTGEDLTEEELFKLDAHATYVLRMFEIQYNLAQSGELSSEQAAILQARIRRSMAISEFFGETIAKCLECYSIGFKEWLGYERANI